MDRLTKYAHFLLIKHPYTAKSVAELFVREVVRLHGVPVSIVSDRDPTFMSHFWKELFRLQGTTLRMSTSYHPETNEQTEVLTRVLETSSLFCSRTTKKLDKLVTLGRILVQHKFSGLY